MARRKMWKAIVRRIRDLRHNRRVQYRILVTFQVGMVVRVLMSICPRVHYRDYFLTNLLRYVDNNFLILVTMLMASTNWVPTTYLYYHQSTGVAHQIHQLTIVNQRVLIEANPVLGQLLDWANFRKWKANVVIIYGLVRSGTLHKAHVHIGRRLEGFLINASVIRAQVFGASVVIQLLMKLGSKISLVVTMFYFLSLLYGQQLSTWNCLLMVFDYVCILSLSLIVHTLIEHLLMMLFYQLCVLRHLNKVFAIVRRRTRLEPMAIKFIAYHRRVLLAILDFDKHFFHFILSYAFYCFLPYMICGLSYILTHRIKNFHLLVGILILLVAMFTTIMVVLLLLRGFHKVLYQNVVHFPLVQLGLRRVANKLRWLSYYQVLHSTRPIGYSISIIGVVLPKCCLEFVLLYFIYVIVLVKFLSLPSKQGFIEAFGCNF